MVRIGILSSGLGCGVVSSSSRFDSATVLVCYSGSVSIAFCSNESRGKHSTLSQPRMGLPCYLPYLTVSALWWLVSDVMLFLSAILRPWMVMWGGSLGLLGLGVSF